MSRDDAIRGLHEAIDAFAADRAPELVEEARAEALAKVRRVLAETMSESLLAHSRQALEPKREVASGPSSERRSTPEETRPHSGAAGPPLRSAARPEAGGGARSQEEAEVAHYVYGVVPARTEFPRDLAGIDPRYEVSLLEEEGLAALVSRVSLAEFGEEPLHENLNDVGWLEEKARAHEHVLDVAVQRGTVVPLRLCTIYSGEEQVREMLARERAVMTEALERLDGKAEWGVKAIAEPRALERAAAQRAGEGSEEGDASRGTAYMNRKRREAQAREEEMQIADEWASAIHDRLADAASEALLNPLQDPDVSGHDGDMLLNGVYLIEERAVPNFSALVERLADEYRPLGASVELTGPWPPYNFVKSSIESAR
ncbi:MAG TPA: GvpL/GvpF family gas vesicle protein [Solirubrobacterales bacterium]